MYNYNVLRKVGDLGNCYIIVIKNIKKKYMLWLLVISDALWTDDSSLLCIRQDK